MATFSSVARRPGQTIKPKAVPRKTIQRTTARPIPAPAVESLTPESLPESPHVQRPREPLLTSETPSHDSASRPSDKDVETPLSPPATAVERDTSTAAARIAVESQELLPDSPPPQSSATGDPTSGGSAFIVAEPQTRTVTKRRSDAVQEHDTLSKTVANHNDVNTTGLRTPASSVPARKRRKVAPQASASHLLSHSTELNTRARTETPANERSTSVSEDRVRASTVDLLKQATASFGSVSKIADSIEDRTRSLRPRSTRASGAISYVEVDDHEETPARPDNHRGSRNSAIETAAFAVVERAAVGRKRKDPKEEVEDPENYEIDPDTVTMGFLTRDRGLGKRSATGRELEENWPEISQRWKERSEENRKRALERRAEEKRAKKLREKNATTQLEDGEELVSQAPDSHIPLLQAVIRNGNVVVENEDRQITFSKNLSQKVQDHEKTRLDVRPIYNYVNSNNLGKHAGLRSVSARWDEESTDLFYRGLRIFGTDLEMIASLFPSKEREDIKNKYVRELRDDATRVEDSLKNREDCSIEEYEELIGRDTSIPLPELLQKELDEITTRLKKEAAEKEREENPFVHLEGADEPVQSIEVDAEGNETVREQTEGLVIDDHTRRIANLAGAVIDAAATPAAAKKIKRHPRRETSKIIKSKKGKQTLAGVEEVIGRTGEVDR